MKIITDSSCDLPDSLLKEYEIEVVPLTITFAGEGEYLEGVDLSKEEFREKLGNAKVLPRTTAVDPNRFLAAFQKALKETGEVIYVGLSSRLSGTFQAAALARDILGTNKVHLIDSLSASIGVGVLALRAAQLVRKGMALPALLDKLSRLRDNMITMCTMDTLENLVQGGRLSRVQGRLGSLLDIKPVILGNDGKLHMVDRVRGRHKALSRISSLLVQYSKGCSNKLVGIAHFNCLDDVMKIKEYINQTSTSVDYLISDMGASMATHGGPGTIVIACIE